MSEYLLTTVDNPFNPFTEPDQWLSYDNLLGHGTPSFLARVAVVADSMSESDIELAIERAIDEIVYENVNGLYRKVQRTE
jgi:hypothetical protein